MLSFDIERNPGVDTKVHIRHVNDADTPKSFKVTRVLADGISRADIITDMHAHLSGESRTLYQMSLGMSADFTKDLGLWAAIGATAPGVIDPFTVPANPQYQLSPAGLWFKPLAGTAPATKAVMFKTPLILGEGEQVEFAMGIHGGTGATLNNELFIGLCLNASTVSHQVAPLDGFLWDGADDSIDHFTSWTAPATQTKSQPRQGENLYWKLIRPEGGTLVKSFFSFVEGPDKTWAPLTTVDAVNHTQLWLFAELKDTGAEGGSIMHTPGIFRSVSHTAYSGGPS